MGDGDSWSAPFGLRGLDATFPVLIDWSTPAGSWRVETAHMLSTAPAWPRPAADRAA